MYCVEALGCLSVYIDTEVYVYMQVSSASAAGSLKKINYFKGHKLPTVNCQVLITVDKSVLLSTSSKVQRSRTTHCQLSTVKH